MASKLQLLTLLLPMIFFAQACGKASQSNKKAPVPEGFSLSDENHFQVKAEWALPLKHGGDGTNEVVLSFLNADGVPPQSVTVREFHPRMPFMGNHGTDGETQAFLPGSGPASVRVTGIYFNMAGGPGEWVVTVKAVVDGKTDEIKVAVPEVL